MFEVDRIYCSDITGFGVRPFPDLVFEVDRILQQRLENMTKPLNTLKSDTTKINMFTTH